jgi:hypothetical protein
MIVIDEGSDLLLITQPDHAHLAAEILSLCRFTELVDNPRRAALLRATREHDNDWQELDAAPPVDAASGLPYTFTTLPDDLRRELWTRASERFRRDDAYVALLIAQHAVALHRQRSDDGPWADWLGEIRALRDELLEEVEIDPQTLESDYSLLRFADLCALAICTRSPEPFEFSGVRGRFDGNALYLDPLPLAGTTSFEVACRRIPRRPYASTIELGSELAGTRWKTLTLRIADVPD